MIELIKINCNYWCDWLLCASHNREIEEISITIGLFNVEKSFSFIVRVHVNTMNIYYIALVGTMVHLTKTFNFVNYKRLILYSWYAEWNFWIIMITLKVKH